MGVPKRLTEMQKRFAECLVFGGPDGPVNKAEAESGSLFIGGWRPFVGWVCGIGLMYNVLLSQILAIWFEVPTVDPSLLTPVLLGMLGMGGLRSWEKTKKVAKK